MSENTKDISSKALEAAGDAELEKLLRRAPPRQMPDDAAVAATRAAVHDEWRTVVGRQQRRGRARWAIAATMLIGVFATVGLYRPAAMDIVQVAQIQKSFGAVSIFGVQSPDAQVDNLATVYSGQTIVTGPQAGMAIAWGNGGSIRVDRNTKLEILSDAAIFLHTGRVYFDSTPSELIVANAASEAAKFVVETEHGLVSHIGTQFMTAVDNDALVVSVREGRVAVRGPYHNAAVASREKVTLIARSRPVTSTDSGYGKEWAWIARTTPPIDAGGESIDRFLTWVGRELGLEVRYETGARQIAVQHDMMRGLGLISREPREALALYMDTTRLHSEIVGGVIHVRVSK